jgi:hypothetical protein
MRVLEKDGGRGSVSYFVSTIWVNFHYWRALLGKSPPTPLGAPQRRGVECTGGISAIRLGPHLAGFPIYKLAAIARGPQVRTVKDIWGAAVPYLRRPSLLGWSRTHRELGGEAQALSGTSRVPG